ncbi:MULTISPECIES: SURF1 family protein [Pseudomonas]|uniref:SURF1 family protein n=1 Tax=Pseudomonas TaxID=286 RepID=UPI001BE89198|nr:MULTISPECIES: SURF1 family protein [Pseudomonas]MBT2341948.1 SURF1 family protein [Pseudomonas fluorescens]MCD4532089.1 SURF1 family protein [Pseudomonas sp. C3-2018]
MKGFRPGLVPSLVVAVLMPVMVCLGFWQLSRGEQKRVLMQTYAERRVAPAMDSAELAQTTDPAFRAVKLQGQFDVEHSVLLDNRQHDGKVGVELLQPFLDHATGLWLLVNRGWLPWPDRRTPPLFSTPEQPVSLQAWVYVAPGATFQLHADPTAAPWPRLVTAVEPDKLWAELGRSGFTYELRQQNGPGAYRTDWPVVSMGPEKHLGYAVQWFAMAAALFGLFLYLGWHNARRPHGNHHESNQHV